MALPDARHSGLHWSKHTGASLFKTLGLGLILLILVACAPSSQTQRALTAQETPQGDYQYSLDNGGSLVIKREALPLERAANISLSTPWQPTLPDNVEIIGDAVLLQTDREELDIPARLELPLPDTVDGPERLYVATVDQNGAAILLVPEIQGDTLRVLLPRLGSFALVRVNTPDATPFRDTLAGKPELVVKETAIYRVLRSFETPPANAPQAQLKLTPEQAQEEWRVYGDVELLESNGLTAKIQAKAAIDSGSAVVTVFFLNPNDGLRYLAGTEIAITQPSDPQALFKANLLTLQPLLSNEQQAAEFTAQVTDVATPPITWSWEYGDGDSGGPVTTDTLSFTLPAKRYKPSNGQAGSEYRVKLTASDSAGLSASAEFPVVVTYAADQAAPLAASIDCPTRNDLRDPPCSLRLNENSISAAYLANVSGGTPPYRYFWHMAPLQDQYTEGSDSQTFDFSEPGDYRLKLKIEDQAQQVVEITQPVTILGTPLQISLNGLSGNDDKQLTLPNNQPIQPRPGDTVTVNLNFQGGVLIAAGQRSDYEVRFNWEDGTTTPSSLVLDPLPGNPPDVPRALELSHTYLDDGVYFIRATVRDASGTLETVRKRLCVGVCNNGIGNYNTDTNRNNTTGYIGLAYGNGPASDITVTQLKNFGADFTLCQSPTPGCGSYPTAEDIANADIQISGPAIRPTFTWNRRDVIKVSVDANCIGNCDTAVYGVQVVDDISVIASPLQYGDYSRPNTEVLPFQYTTYYNPSPDLVASMEYTVTMVTRSGDMAFLKFLTN